MATADVYRETLLSALQHRNRPWSELKSICQVNAVADSSFAEFVKAVDGLVKDGRVERVVAADRNSVYRIKGS